jgi:hypothetical protein
VTEHIDDMIMLLDNNEGAYQVVKEIVMEVGADGPAEIGQRIKDFVSESSSNQLADMMLAEFMGSVNNRDLGEYYIDAFEDELEHDDEEEDEG